MAWLISILALVLLLGPLRRWAGRHWALLLSLAAGAVFGFVVGSVLTAMSPVPPWTPWLGAAACAVAAAESGPCWLRRMSRDGRSGEDDPRGH